MRHLFPAGYRAPLADAFSLRDVGAGFDFALEAGVRQMADLLFVDVLGKPAWMWVSFIGLVLVLLAFDLGVLHREDAEITIGGSLVLSTFYIGVAVLFGGLVWLWFGTRPDGSSPALEYFTGYFIEKSLSIDNVFVISLIFGYFAVPPRFQYRALVWGILGVVVLRGIMIGAGAALVRDYHWILYVFGAFLIFTGIRMLVLPQGEPDIAGNPLIAFLRRHMRVTEELSGDKFFVRRRDPATGKVLRYATPLFLALVVINVADIVFAVDSVPAIFAVTTDPFVVYTANIMAILGLRALYFALAAMVHRFHYLSYALALVLVFIGAKIFWNEFVAKLDPAIALAVTLLIILGGVVFSLWRTRRDGEAKAASPRPAGGR
jgi:tellurite resistance protein TerC